jgi:hypothetical protein
MRRTKMNKKELKIYLSFYDEYMKSQFDETERQEYFSIRTYHELNKIDPNVFDIIENLYEYDKDIDRIIEVLKIYNLYEE